MVEDVSRARFARQARVRYSLPIRVMVGILGITALGFAAYVGYSYSARGSAVFAIGDVPPGKWRMTRVGVEQPVQTANADLDRTEPVRPEPPQDLADAQPSDPELVDLEKELEQPKVVASVKPYSGVVYLPLALVAALETAGEESKWTARYTLPPILDPVSAIPDTRQNMALRQLLQGWRNGAPGPVDFCSSAFREIVEASGLRCVLLYELGHAVGLVEGDQTAEVFYGVAVTRAPADLAPTTEQSIRCQTIDALYGMAAIYAERSHNYVASERICRLLHDVDAGNRTAQRRSEVLLARVLIAKQPTSPDGPLALLKHLLAEPLPDEQRQEVTSMLAQVLFDAGRYEDATASLANWDEVDPRSPCADQGWALRIGSAVKQGQGHEARRLFLRWRQMAGVRHPLPLDRDAILVASWPD